MIENQFGKFEIKTGVGRGLLVPTQKIEPGSAFPEELDHFKVYRLAEVIQLPGATLQLRDQFGREEVKLYYPQFFAVPVMKKYNDRTYEIHNKAAHLLIVSVTNKRLDRKINIKNQFGRLSIRVVNSLGLGVPCVKHEWKML